VHEVLNRRRDLTLGMIRRLHEGLGIPAESLSRSGSTRLLEPRRSRLPRQHSR
jgi:HTH-type transcriptional regulator/antitoxin HigA